MATKKIKGNLKVENDVEVSNNLKLAAATAERALVLNASGNVVASAVTDTELATLSGVSSDIQTQLDAKVDDSEKGAASGVATLDAGGKIPSAQLPAIAITEVFSAATIAARDALTVGAGAGEIQEGDVVIVTDASADAGITSGAASYIYDGAVYQLLKAGDEVLSVNGTTGTVVLDADDISDAATTNKFATAAQLTKVDFISITQAVDLDSVESLATSATQPSDNISTLTNDSSFVDAAGAKAAAVVNSTAGSETDQAPSVAAVKLLVGSGASAGDLSEANTALANNQAAAADVTGLAFANGVVRSFKAQVTVIIDATADLYEVHEISGVQKAASWDMSVESVGDDSLIVFSITSAGQVQYTSTNHAGFVSIDCKFRADTLSI